MVIINGEISSECNIVLDSGFYYGRGVFETILVKNRPVFLKQHCERLKRGLEKLGVVNEAGEVYIKECVRKYDIHDCVLKVVATEKNTVVITRDITYKPEDYLRGFCVKLSSLRRNPFSHITGLKSLNYTDNIIEKEQAMREGYDEVIFLNTQNELAEGSMSNLFFVKEGIIYTPDKTCGILNGIVREWVLENFEVNEGKYTLEALLGADEVFITNSIMGIMKVKAIENTKIYGEDKIYKLVRHRYEKEISIFETAQI